MGRQEHLLRAVRHAVCLIVTVVVSLMTKAPSKEMQDLVDSVRIPRGDMPAGGGEADPALIPR